MQGYNLIAAFSPDMEKILMCRRKKEPYLGQLNFPGGKVEPGETAEAAAYRELFEETAFTRDDICLVHMMDLSYPVWNCYINVYIGRLGHEAPVHGDENELLWMDGLKTRDFSAPEYAGDGNIWYIMHSIWDYTHLLGQNG